MKLTDWFPGEVKPARAGFYQRDYRFYANEPICVEWEYPDYYDGFSWFICREGTPELHPSYGCFPWRGLAEKPE